MTDFLSSLSLFCLALTLGAFAVALWLQKKTRSPLCNPILIGAVLIMGVLLLMDFDPKVYADSTEGLTWLLTPATISLAVPLHKQLKALKKNLPAILTGILAGSVASLVVVFFLCRLFSLDRQITVSLLPKSITSTFGMELAEQNGGLSALALVIIIFTGILGNLLGGSLCKLLKLDDPVSRGVAFGTSSHLGGTSKATELSTLTGAVSSLSLVVAGIVTTLLFPLVCHFL